MRSDSLHKGFTPAPTSAMTGALMKTPEKDPPPMTGICKSASNESPVVVDTRTPKAATRQWVSYREKIMIPKTDSKTLLRRTMDRVRQSHPDCHTNSVAGIARLSAEVQANWADQPRELAAKQAAGGGYWRFRFQS